MLDLSGPFKPRQSGTSVQKFTGWSYSGTVDWQVWEKPLGKTMLMLILQGDGGDGGTGVIGANSTAAGGGGGGGGGLTVIMVPLAFIPDRLYVGLIGISSVSATQSFVSISPSGTSADVLAYANSGANGGNAAGATAGTAGAAANAANNGGMALGWPWVVNAVAGVAGTAGGTVGASGSVALPGAGQIATSGTGGSGLGAAAVAGSAAGNITGSGSFPTLLGGVAPAVATTPPGNGNSGFAPVQKAAFYYGGTGGASTHGTATGAGLVQASGGDGREGCGGGGMGGALTGSTPGRVGRGGPATATFICW